MSFLRPTGAALARQLCNTRARSECASRSPILALVHSYRASRPQCRAFSQSLRISARVVDTPQNPSIPQSPKRTVRIGPLPKGPVDDDTIRRIFGKRLSAHEGNNVLRILHHRRTAGSLADYGVDNLGKQYTHVSRETALKGLEWLRQKYPIDEARAAEEWAEKEANRISYELWLADPETESKYKDPARAFKEQMEKEEQERLQQESEDQKIGILHVGKSQFERNIEEKRKARLEEATRAAEEKEQNERDMEAKLASGEWVRTPTGKQLMKPGQTTYVDLFGKEQVSRRKEEMEKYTKASQTTDAETPEQLLAKTTVVQRLVPMTVFVFFIVAASWAFAHFYAPPSPEYRVIPDLSIALSTIGAIFAINVVVSLAFRIMPLWPIMTRYFMHAPAYPYAVSSISNVFAHVQYEHLLGNMMMLGLVGYVCCDYVGRGVFMGTYISGGAMGTLFSLYWANLGRGSIFAHSVGASAAIWAVATLYCLITDQERLKIPIVHTNSEGVTFWPKMLLGAFIAFEMFTAARGKAQWADHASHFGGMFVGASVAGYLRLTGSLEKKNGALRAESAQANAGIGSEIVDVGAMAKQEIKEVKDSLGKSSN